MDSIDSAYLWAAFSLLPLAMTLLYLRSRYNELIALHLIIFWLQMFAYGFIWIYGNETFRFSYILLLGLELTIYFAVLTVMPLGRFASTVSDAARAIPGRWLFFWLLASMAVTIYVITTYGILSLIPNAGVAESMGLPSWLTYLNWTLAIPAWGAVFCCCIRWRWAALVVVAFVGLHLFVDGNEGKRLLLIVAGVWVLFRRKGLTWSLIPQVVAAAACLLIAWVAYQGVRDNLRYSLLTNQRYDSGIDMVAALVTPTKAVDSAYLQTRQPPIYLLEEITERPNLAHGAFIMQSFYNVLPSALGKTTTKTENEVLADEMEFPFQDYPWTLLSELQAEAGPFAAILTPLLYLALFWICWMVIGRWHGHSPMIVLAAIGVAVFTAGEVQTVITTAWVYLRALGLVIAFGIAWEMPRHFLRALAIHSALDKSR